MNILWIDYETYYAPDYRLKNKGAGLIRTEYINDPRFKAHGAAVAIDETNFQWITHKHLPEFFNDMAPHFDAMCCFNGLFDHGITARYYLPKPEKYLLDSASMWRGAMSTKHPQVGGSLDAVSRFLFPDRPDLHKHVGGLDPSYGIRDLPEHIERSLASYACQDGVVMRAIFQRLLQEQYPWREALDDIHLTLAMGVYPQLKMNSAKAAAIFANEVKKKAEAAARMGITREELRSAERFAQLLREFGAEPPTKYSEKQGKMVYAFAKTDEGMRDLLQHDSPEVQLLAEARLGEKAAQDEKRSALFARLPADLPVPVGYARAHTGRHGGEEYNMQNLGKDGELRTCVEAPKGRKVLVRDLSQIELRMNAWFCGEQWLVDMLAAGGDPYCQLATKIFGRPITKADEFERFIGKQGELSCGYQVGKDKTLTNLRSKGVDADLPLAKKVVYGFRDTHPAIVAMWKKLQTDGMYAICGQWQPWEHKGVWFEQGRILLPSGRSLWYPDLKVNEQGEWVYRVNKQRNKGAEWKHIFGGAMLENIIQALSFDVFMFHARRCWREYGLRMAMAVHDEMDFVVPEDRVQWADEVVSAVQRVAPAWCQGLPLNSEGSWGDNYYEAK